MQNIIEVNTLGQLYIRLNGHIADDFISTKAILLCVYLAMNPGEHTRRKLAGMFWSETHDQQALKNLRTVLSNIRQQVPDVVIISRDTLTINPEFSIQVDALEFETGCAAALAAANPGKMLTQMRALADMYQGAFIADGAFRDAETLDNWISEKQRYYHELYVRLLHDIVEQVITSPDYDTAIQYARRLVNLDPYWDTAQRQLMRLLAYTNRANDALQQYENFRLILATDLEAEPEPETIELAEQIRSRELRPPHENTSSIVLPDLPFVEAAEDISLIQRMLNTPQCRLLTVYGISGIGKTALATQIAYKRQSMYTDGAFLVPIKPSQTAQDLPTLIADTLHLLFSGQTMTEKPAERVIDYLRTKDMLLVLDNYENLLPETQFIETILEEAPTVQIMVTSQLPLNMFREWLLPLQGLRVPTADDPNPEQSEAVQLFDLTAQRINPRFKLMDHLHDVVEICQLVDGLPLALIIAAGWTQVIPVRKIKDYIIEGQEFNLPRQQDLPSHQQSLEMMLNYTWNNLDLREQYALTGLSIFQTSFDFEDVQKIQQIDLNLLTSLIQKSLIQRYGDQYRMHQLIWRYARKKLLYSEDREELAQRFQDYILQLLQVLQKSETSLHDYLLKIEQHYSQIWNYDWMPRSFQSTYVLELSRYLTIYWETSNKDQQQVINKLLSSIDASETGPEHGTILNLQLARVAINNRMPDQANLHLQHILREDIFNTSWLDWAMAFYLNLRLLTYSDPDTTSYANQEEKDNSILTNTYVALLGLYLDMRDYENSQAFFDQFTLQLSQPVCQSLILATEGAMLAETQEFAAAYSILAQALNTLSGDDQPLLQLVLHSLMMRIAQILKQHSARYQHLDQALYLAASQKSVTAMLNLIQFSLDHVRQGSLFEIELKTAFEQLQRDTSKRGEVIALAGIAAGLAAIPDRS